MTRMTSALTTATLLALGMTAVPAQAQLARTWVSSLGNDANDCNRSTPCRSFQRAHDNTLALGEISVLDPGGYGAVTITKGISIINDGVGEAGALVSGGLNGITINAGLNGKVSLRGLTIKGIGFGGGNGIVFNNGKSLTIENCVVRNLTGNAQNNTIGHGIIFAPNASSSLAVSNTLVADNDGHGITIVPTGSGTVSATMNRVESYGNGSVGIIAFGGTSTGLKQVTVVDSVAAFNGFAGIMADSNSALVNVDVQASLVAYNGVGILASNFFARVTVAGSTLTGNDGGVDDDLKMTGGAIISFGNNYTLSLTPVVTQPRR